MKHPCWFRRAGWMCLALSLACAAQARRKPRTDIRVADAPNRSSNATREAGQAAQAHNEYVIGPGDVLAIDVWHEPEISRVEPVRPDGRITLPLVGQVEASGETTSSLQEEIAARLTRYIHRPAVAVIVQQANSQRFNVIGDVLRPGSYSLAARTTVLDAIAVAGGFGEFAKVTHIYIVRSGPGGSSLRIPFNYKAAVRGNERYLDLALKPGDTVIVP